MRWPYGIRECHVVGEGTLVASTRKFRYRFFLIGTDWIEFSP